MFSSNGSSKKWAAEWILVMFVLTIASVSWAAGWSSEETPTVKKLSLLTGKSIVLKSQEPVKRISIADPAVADFVLISPNEIYITGKTAGLTNMTLWQKNGGYRVFDLDVGFDVSQMKQQLDEILSRRDRPAGDGYARFHHPVGARLECGESFPGSDTGPILRTRRQGQQPGRGPRGPTGHAGGAGGRDAAQPGQTAGR